MAVRSTFFLIHFVVGFAALWLCFALVKESFPEVLRTKLWSETLLETSFLVGGVVWGNLGWDSFNRLKDSATGSNMAYELAKSTAPLAVALPFFLLILDFVYVLRVPGLSWTWHWQQFVLAGLGTIVVALLISFWCRRRSPEAIPDGA